MTFWHNLFLGFYCLKMKLKNAINKDSVVSSSTLNRQTHGSLYSFLLWFLSDCSGVNVLFPLIPISVLWNPAWVSFLSGVLHKKMSKKHTSSPPFPFLKFLQMTDMFWEADMRLWPKNWMASQQWGLYIIVNNSQRQKLASWGQYTPRPTCAPSCSLQIP